MFYTSTARDLYALSVDVETTLVWCTDKKDSNYSNYLSGAVRKKFLKKRIFLELLTKLIFNPLWGAPGAIQIAACYSKNSPSAKNIRSGGKRFSPLYSPRKALWSRLLFFNFTVFVSKTDAIELRVDTQYVSGLNTSGDERRCHEEGFELPGESSSEWRIS